jgi:hypothetical protein
MDCLHISKNPSKNKQDNNLNNEKSIRNLLTKLDNNKTDFKRINKLLIDLRIFICSIFLQYI